MRRMIVGMQVTLDGFIEGPSGEIDWIGGWEDTFSLPSDIDTCILGGGMYAGYEQYWLTILADPEAVLPYTGRPATEGEVEYAKFADRTPHVVLSRTLDDVAWKTTRIVRDVEEIRRMKEQPGKTMYVVGGATLVSNFINLGLIDELRLTVHPLILAGGKALFKDVEHRQPLELVDVKSFESGKVGLTYVRK